MKQKNHKGAKKIISVYWFVILFIVAGAVVYMAAVFYGEPYDVRELEANVLMNQIADCISQGGKMRDDILDEDKFNNENFLEICHLTFNVEDFKGWNNDQYFIKIDFEKFEGGSARESIENGDARWKDYRDKEGKDLPKCVERSFYTLDENDKYIIKILSVVRKTEKNVE